jgi:signal transduction histidine kinase
MQLNTKIVLSKTESGYHSHSEGDMAVFAIEDTGIGFDMQYTERVFDLFLQLHPGDLTC